MRKSRCRRRGSLIIVGWKVISTREAAEPVRCACPACGVADAIFVGRLRRAWFTVFYIPVAPLDPIENAERISQCRECGKLFDVPIEQMAHRARRESGADYAGSIALYNQLRDRPTDGKLMLRLLEVYEAMGELREAEAAARVFPEAFKAEPRCEIVLGRMRANAADVVPSGA